MARPPGPWRRAGRGWYAQVDGQQVKLATAAEGKAVAQRRLAEMVRAAGSTAGPTPPLGELVALYLLDMARRRDAGEVEPQTKDDAERRLAGLAEMHGDMPADELKEHHIAAWVEGRRWVPKHRTTARRAKQARPGRRKAGAEAPPVLPPDPPPGPRPLGATARHDCVGAVKSLMKWAVRTGRLAANPIAEVAKPKRKLRREEVPTAGELRLTMAVVLSDRFRELLTFLHETGCRPKEARELEAGMVDRAAGVAVLSRHKTAKKTGTKRVIYLGSAAAMVARLCEANPSGPIFRNTEGNPWTKDAVVQAMARVRGRAIRHAAAAGLPRPDPKALVAYALRHLFITDAAARGVSGPLLAKLAGHADMRMLATYSHLDDRHDELREAAAKVRGEPG